MFNFKKSRKTIVFFAALAAVLCCMVVLIGAFSGESEPGMTPDGAPPAHADTISGSEPSPFRTEEHKKDEQEVRALVEAFGKQLRNVSCTRDVVASKKTTAVMLRLVFCKNGRTIRKARPAGWFPARGPTISIY